MLFSVLVEQVVSRTKKTVVGAELNGHVGTNPGFFQKCIEEKAVAKGTETGRTSWKARRA